MIFSICGKEFNNVSDFNFVKELKEFINELPPFLAVYSINNKIFVDTEKHFYVDKGFFTIPLIYRFKHYLNTYSVSDSLDKLYNDVFVNLKLIEEELFDEMELEKDNKDSVKEFNKLLNDSVIDLDMYSELLDDKDFITDLESKLCRIHDLFNGFKR